MFDWPTGQSIFLRNVLPLLQIGAARDNGPDCELHRRGRNRPLNRRYRLGADRTLAGRRD
jgi:hypothetical protein